MGIPTDGDDAIYGTENDDVIDALDGNDVIRGAGGNDTLYGGFGNDVIWSDDGDDLAYGGADDDTFWCGIGNDRAYGGAGKDSLLGEQGNDRLYGEAGNDSFRADEGDDYLDGGSGADFMDGGNGADTYVVDNSGDRPFEGFSTVHAIDTVLSSISFVLENPDNLIEGIENLTLLGTGALYGMGNGLDNVIRGNAGDNKLGGDAGTDRLFGGNGNDVLTGGSGADTLNGEAGIDRVAYATAPSGVTVSLANATLNTGHAKGDVFVSIENLSGSAFADKLLGDHGVNLISGGAGNDVIKGYRGNDTLSGGTGSDTFIFNSALGTANVDRITDYSAAADTIQLDNAYFKALAATGGLAASAFRANASGLAQDANDRIIYETDTGELYYDGNGSAAGGAVLFARLVGTPALTSADFVVI